jgi:ABC-type antimicrobial peptide transport system permease subunit
MAVRGALGASRIRLVRQYVTESSLLVVVGTVFGLILALGMKRVLHSLISKDMLVGMPYLDHLGIRIRCIVAKESTAVGTTSGPASLSLQSLKCVSMLLPLFRMLELRVARVLSRR